MPAEQCWIHVDHCSDTGHWWTKSHGVVLSVKNLPLIQRWHQLYAAENLTSSYLGAFGLVLRINVKLSLEWYLR